MNVNAILNYEADPNEDYYNLLGCDSSASTEQIIAEYKAKAKDYHPDKNNTADDYDQLQSREKFQHLLRAKEVLTDPQERGLYDAWTRSGIAMRYATWRNLKSSVRSSMHWATPKTSGRMLEMTAEEVSGEPLSLNPSPVNERDLVQVQEDASDEQATIDDDKDTTYDPTPYEKVGFRINTPPPTFWNDEDDKKNLNMKQEQQTQAEQYTDPSSDPATAMRRRQFAVRRQSTIGTMIWAEKYDDNEIRRRFRNYEI